MHLIAYPVSLEQENAHVRVAIGFGSASHWLRKWREVCWPITERSNAKPKQTIYFRHSIKNHSNNRKHPPNT